MAYSFVYAMTVICHFLMCLPAGLSCHGKGRRFASAFVSRRHTGQRFRRAKLQRVRGSHAIVHVDRCKSTSWICWDRRKARQADSYASRGSEYIVWCEHQVPFFCERFFGVSYLLRTARNSGLSPLRCIGSNHISWRFLRRVRNDRASEPWLMPHLPPTHHWHSTSAVCMIVCDGGGMSLTTSRCIDPIDYCYSILSCRNILYTCWFVVVVVVVVFIFYFFSHSTLSRTYISEWISETTFIPIQFSTTM